MGQMADITVYDGAATPVQHVLSPVDSTRVGNKLTMNWREVAGSSLPTEAQMRLTAILETLSSGVTKVEVRLEVPVQEVVTGSNSAGYSAAPKVAYVDTVYFGGFFNKRSTSTGRRLARQLVVNLGNNVTTSVAANGSGPVPQLFDYLLGMT
jgi:hypothetical protein